LQIIGRLILFFVSLTILAGVSIGIYKLFDIFFPNFQGDLKLLAILGGDFVVMIIFFWIARFIPPIENFFDSLDDLLYS
jgi:hypothetical protein